ncbi:hypothetical protein CTEN210_03786 [Chaetoceros tenuissimus]|uniref:Cation efflux protein transmembrane domain-containing protein n=1 Tax=Chaetoceros tenuissimus TaxID=426638 RepID=A0AAD3H1Y3_9STRA|nr:hypothetical protein CTEN210_03786 [Chaetoceros tenuissimus]
MMATNVPIKDASDENKRSSYTSDKHHRARNGNINVHEDKDDEERNSNEYVLNFAFFSFLLFMMTQAFFAVMAKSESMLADSMAMSVDAFTYLFNLVAERLKHRSSLQYENLSIEEAKRRKKILRLYLEFFPPMISVTTLIIVSFNALMEAVHTLIDPPMLRLGKDEDISQEEPDVKIMIFFSALNLGLDVMNVLCFARVQNFSLTGNRTVKDDEESKHIFPIADDDEEALHLESTNMLHEMPPSIIIDTSRDSSCDDHDDYVQDDLETEGLLGIPTPNYGSYQSDAEWGENFSMGSMGVLYGNASQNDSLTSGGISITSAETGESLGSGNHSNSHQSRRSKARDLGAMDELDGISEGEENSDDDDDENLSIDNDDCNSNDSEDTDRGFNLNMCSAYTHVMADTMRSIAVLVAASISWYFNIDPSLADATAAIIVSAIIALSLGPLIVGLCQTWGELQTLKKEERESKESHVRVTLIEQYQHLPSVSPRITMRRPRNSSL